MSLSVCSRTGDIVEPMIKPQWLVNCNTMAKASLDAVRSKKIEIIPQQYEQDWYRYIYSFLYILVDLCCPFQ
jgi:valyl-tRNA synthetase